MVVELMTENPAGANRMCFRMIAAVAVPKKPRVPRLRKSASATTRFGCAFVHSLKQFQLMGSSSAFHAKE
jgi:hypothetical protein